MHKPEKPMDSVKEMEDILKRLAPSAMSERASRANEAMIDGLADRLSNGDRAASNRQYWWQAGIAASLMAGAGLVFWDQPRADSLVEYEILKNNIKSLEQISEDVRFDLDDGDSWVSAGYREEDINEVRDKENGLVIQIGRREEGNALADISEF